MEEGEYGFAGWLVIIIINGSHRGRDESLLAKPEDSRKGGGRSTATAIPPTSTPYISARLTLTAAIAEWSYAQSSAKLASLLALYDLLTSRPKHS